MSAIVAMSEDDYHAHPALGSSGVRKVLRSPAHYRASVDLPSVPTAAMVEGSLLHSLVLEPHMVEQRFAVEPKADRRTKAGKALHADFRQSLAGRTAVSEGAMSVAVAMRDAIRAHAPSARLLDAAEAIEGSIFWTDPASGIDCKARPDALSDGLCVDVKKCKDASPSGFARAIATYGYHVQAAVYLEALRQAGQPAEGFVFLCVEPAPPYAVGAYLLDDESIGEGTARFHEALATVAECTKADVWPAYEGGRVTTIGLPRWAFTGE